MGVGLYLDLVVCNDPVGDRVPAKAAKKMDIRVTPPPFTSKVAQGS